jgi:hypothetical protein
VYSTVPIKYLLSINLLLSALYQFPSNEISAQEKTDCFQFVDLLVDRIRETKYKEEVDLKVKGLRVKFRFLPKGESLGASMAIVKLDNLRLGYLVDYGVQDEVHIPGIDHKLTTRVEFDYLLTCLSRKADSTIDLRSALERAIKANPKCIILVDQIPRLFEVLLATNEVLARNDAIFSQIFIPQIYRYYVDCVKRLSEYMPTEISQTMTIGEEDLFKLKYMTYDDGVGKGGEEKTSVYLCTVADFLLGKVFKNGGNFKEFDVVFCDQKTKKVYERLVSGTTDDTPMAMVVEPPTENGDTEGTNWYNRLIGSFKNASKEYLGEQEETTAAGTSDLETQANTSAVTPAGHTKVSAVARRDDFETDTQEVYFTFKNHDIFFLMPKSEKPASEYGFALTEIELSSMEYSDPSNKEGAEFDQEIKAIHQEMTKSKDFFDKYIPFAGNPAPWNPALRTTRVLEYSWQASSKDQVIMLTKIPAKSLVFLNTPEPSLIGFFQRYSQSLNSNPSINIVSAQKSLVSKQQFLSVDFHPSELDHLEFVTVNDDLRFAKIQFTLEKRVGSKFELKVQPRPPSQLYKVIKKLKLVKVKDFMAKNGLHFGLEVRRLNLGDKVFIVTTNEEFVVQGMFSEEYFKVRKLLYEFINS